MHNLDNFTALSRLTEFYVAAHNRTIPHSAFQGQTPDEMYFGTGSAVPADLAQAVQLPSSMPGNGIGWPL